MSDFDDSTLDDPQALTVADTLMRELASVGARIRTEAAAVTPCSSQGLSSLRGVIHLKTVHVGPEQIMVAAKIDVASSESAEQLADTIDAAEVNIRTAEPMCRYIYLEPDIRDEDYHPARPTTA